MRNGLASDSKRRRGSRNVNLGRKRLMGRVLFDFGLRHGPNAARLRSVWNVRPGEDFPRLVTCYVL